MGCGGNLAVKQIDLGYIHGILYSSLPSTRAAAETESLVLLLGRGHLRKALAASQRQRAQVLPLRCAFNTSPDPTSSNWCKPGANLNQFVFFHMRMTENGSLRVFFLFNPLLVSHSVLHKGLIRIAGQV